MARSFKYIRIQFGDNTNNSAKSTQAAPSVYKHSMYLQSKDNSWINRNTTVADYDDEIEPLEEDIRD